MLSFWRKSQDRRSTHNEKKALFAISRNTKKKFAFCRTFFSNKRKLHPKICVTVGHYLSFFGGGGKIAVQKRSLQNVITVLGEKRGAFHTWKVNKADWADALYNLDVWMAFVNLFFCGIFTGLKTPRTIEPKPSNNSLKLVPKWEVVSGTRSGNLPPKSEPRKATLMTDSGPVEVCILRSKAVKCSKSGRYKCPVPGCETAGKSRVGIAKHFRKHHKNYRSWRDVFLKKDAPHFVLNDDLPEEPAPQPTVQQPTVILPPATATFQPPMVHPNPPQIVLPAVVNPMLQTDQTQQQPMIILQPQPMPIFVQQPIFTFQPQQQQVLNQVPVVFQSPSANQTTVYQPNQ